MHGMTTWTLLIALVLAATPLAGWAQMKDETLLVTVPAGYRTDHQNRGGNVLLSEMVTQGESGKNWAERGTTKLFFGAKKMCVVTISGKLLTLSPCGTISLRRRASRTGPRW